MWVQVVVNATTCAYSPLYAGGGPPGTPTPDPLIKSQLHGIRKAFDGKHLRPAEEGPSAHLQRAQDRPPIVVEMPPDLAAVAAAWPHLPEALKTGILAMVAASRRGR